MIPLRLLLLLVFLQLMMPIGLRLVLLQVLLLRAFRFYRGKHTWGCTVHRPSTLDAAPVWGAAILAFELPLLLLMRLLMRLVRPQLR